MHASVSGQITCSDPEGCVQPGTIIVSMGTDRAGQEIELEWCERHLTTAARLCTLYRG